MMTARHALYVGWVADLASRHGIYAYSTRDECGDYTNRLTVELDGCNVVLIVPEPPAEWVMP